MIYPLLTSDAVLRAIDDWALGYQLLRELKLSETQRVDAVLVPTSWAAVQGKSTSWPKPKPPSWSRMGLVGVEVKVQRGDFLAGLKKQQFEGYRDLPGILGLYVATTQGVCRTSEIPAGIGHLLCVRRRPTGGGAHDAVVCLRKPVYRLGAPDTETMWRVLFRTRELFEARWRAEYQRGNEAAAKVGERAESVIGRIKGIMEDVAASVGGVSPSALSPQPSADSRVSP